MITPGRYELSEADGDLLLRTVCEGPAARLGHDLTLIVPRWQAILEVGAEPADCRLDVTVELGGLAVLESKGGVKPMSDADRAEIERNAAESLGVDRHPVARFISTGITGTWREGEVTGDLTLNGQTCEHFFQVVVLEGHESGGACVRLGGEIKQRRFGIKPYSTMVGALRVADAVLVEVSVPVPGEDQSA